MRPRMLAQLALMAFCLEGVQAAPLDDRGSSRSSLSAEATDSTTPQAGLLELLRQLEILRNQLASLNGRLEVQSHDLQLLREQQKKIYADLDSRVAALEKLAAGLSSANTQANLPQPPANQNAKSEQPVAPTSAVTSQNQGASSPKNPPFLPPQPQEASTPEQPANVLNEFQMYSTARDLFDRGQYEEAIAAFQKFIATFPQSSNAAAAQYWIGNAYYALKRYDEAIAAQKTLISQYPKHPKVPDAWLNIASSLIAQGKTEEAKSTLRRIIAEYPLSEASEAALSRLRTLP